MTFSPLLTGVRGVLFDMDGVLVDSEPMMAEAAAAMFAERHGVRVSPADFAPYVGTGEKRYLGAVAERYGVTLHPTEDKARAYALYLSLIPGRLRTTPGVRAFIAHGRARGWKLAVATSADFIKMDGSLRAVEMPPASFDAVVCSADITHAKPNPEIFLVASARLGLAPAECLVIEDSPHGVEAACAAGCPCLGLTTTVEAPVLLNAGAGAVAESLERVLRALEG